MLEAQNVANPVGALAGSIPFDFYPILTVGLALVVVLTGRDFAAMRAAERRVREEGKLLDDGAEPLVATEVLMLEPKAAVPPRARNMVIPVVVIVLTVFAGLYVTGGYSAAGIMTGDGTVSVFWAIVMCLLVSGVAYRVQGILDTKELTELFMRGAGGLLPIVVLLLLAFVIGDTCQSLGTGVYIAQAAQAGLPRFVLPAMVFIVSAVMSFSTGTSWGTWAIMFPIAMPMIAMSGLHPGLTLGAVLGGAIFGDHCSPISDSTIISSMAAATDHIAHVRTQLPYALSAAAVSIALYLALGWVL